MAKPEDVRLGQLLIRKRWCSLRSVNRGLEAQTAMRSDGNHKPLGWILVQEENLDIEKLKTALSELGVLRLSCPSCKRETPISNYIPNNTYKCPKCDEGLIFDENVTTSSGSSESIIHSSSDPVSKINHEVSEDTRAEDVVLGKIIGGCQVLSRIAGGGMGVVYKAKQLKLGRTVAVKVLSEELARDKKYVHRFLQEARSAAELNHGNIVHIFDVGEVSGLFYIIMEFVDGSNLREMLEIKKCLDPIRVVEISLQASQALSHAHKRGIIHRDIKPENIMITREGIVKIADLGLAKKIQPDHQDGGITQTKAIMGTPYYMAPEQIKDFRQVDGRTDIYSLGVTLYRALTGSVPYEGRTPVEVMIKVVEGKRPPLRSLLPDILPELENLVDKMMHRSQDDRFQNLVEIIKELDRVMKLLQKSETEKKTTPTI